MEDSHILYLEQQYQKFSDFYLCYCGHAHCEPRHSYGPVARTNYVLHYVLEGRGSYCVEDREYQLKKGEGFLSEPGQQIFYQAGADDPWRCLWVGFDGACCEGCLRALGLGGGRLTFRYGNGEELLGLVEAMLTHRKPDSASAFTLQSLLCQFFACLAKGMSRQVETGLTRTERESLYVHQALEYIRNNYASGITVADVAGYVALNRSYLFTLFRRVLGVSPRDYLTQFRLARARELLVGTNASIANIALSCGYRDPQVFSKAFRQQFGTTPVKYRAQEQAAAE